MTAQHAPDAGGQLQPLVGRRASVVGGVRRWGWCAEIATMKLAAALLGGLLLMACASPTNPRDQLIGRWKSDRAATLAGLEGHPTITPAQRELLEEILGELVVEYSANSLTSNLEDWSESGKYEVVAEGPDFVELRAHDSLLEEEVVRRVWVTDDRMWIWVEGIGFYEFFTRLP
jgi:hypothetical protein